MESHNLKCEYMESLGKERGGNHIMTNLETTQKESNANKIFTCTW